MKCWLIFNHAIQQLTENWRAASQIALPAIIVSFALDAFLYRDYLFLYINDLTKAHLDVVVSFYTGNNKQSYAAFFFKALLILSVAIAWHRHILINEAPSVVPRLHLTRMLVYIFKGSLIFIPVILFMLATFLPFFVYAASENTPSGRLSFVVFFVLFLMLPIVLLASLRMSTILPGAALGAPTSFRETWSKTTGQTGVFFGLGVLFIVMAILSNVAKFPAPLMPLIAALALQTVVVFIQILVSLSILTTLYGHYIENRPLVS